MNQKIKTLLKSFFILTLVALSAHAFATWTPAPANPPAMNTEPPVNVGPVNQNKIGGLWVGGIRAGAGLIDDFLQVGGHLTAGSFQVTAGATGSLGQVLTSMGDTGIAQWQPLPLGGTSGPWLMATPNIFFPDIGAPGNVGIGTNTPLTKLDVAGPIKVGDTSVACSASLYGAQRYNTTLQRMESCIVGNNGAPEWVQMNIPAGNNRSTLYKDGANWKWTLFPSNDGHIFGLGASGTTGLNIIFDGIVVNDNTFPVGQRGLVIGDGTAPVAGRLLSQNANGTVAWTVPQAGTASLWIENVANNAYYQATSTRKLGLGTPSPATKLDIVDGTARLQLLQGTNTSGYTAGIGVNNDGVNFSNSSQWRGFNFKNPNGTLLTIKENGTVGIGTSTPNSLYKLEVNGPTGINGPLGVSGDAILAATPGSKVGIGVSSSSTPPSLSATLDVDGSVRFRSAGTPAAGSVLTSDASGNATWQPVVTGPAGPWTKTGTIISNTVLTDSVGVGTASPGTKFEVKDGGARLQLLQGTNTSGYVAGIGVNNEGMTFSTDSANRGFVFRNPNGAYPAAPLLRIASDGNVGIGTSVQPAEKLEVVGTVKATGLKIPTGAGVGKVLTSDGAGTATWQDTNNYWVMNGPYLRNNPSINFIGIGTGQPIAELDVNGKVRAKELRITASPGVGKVLTSDNLGEATWQDKFPPNPVNGNVLQWVNGNAAWQTLPVAPSIPSCSNTQTLYRSGTTWVCKNTQQVYMMAKGCQPGPSNSNTGFGAMSFGAQCQTLKKCDDGASYAGCGSTTYPSGCSSINSNYSSSQTCDNISAVDFRIINAN